MADNQDIDTSEYHQLQIKAGFVELTDWNFLCLTGRDRQRLLHNFCTADIHRLPTGQTTEAFILNDKGKTLWFGVIMALPDRLLLCGASSIGEKIRSHLDRYVIREDVQVLDQSNSRRGLFVAGAEAAAMLAAWLGSWASTKSLPDRNRCAHILDGELEMTIAQVDLAGWGWVVIFPSSQIGRIAEQLTQSGITHCGEGALHRRRMEQLVPWYGLDIDDANLPQEINRNENAISFTKGCYLGQETVARIDALGHVNQILVGVTIQSTSEPAVGTTVERDGKKIFRLTSFVKAGDGWIGLGYVRREFAEPGVVLPFSEGELVVRTKPLTE